LRIAPLFLFIILLTFYATDWDATSLITTVSTGLIRGGLPAFAGPGWTVLVEFQFYLVFPFLLIFGSRYGSKYLIGLLATFILARAAVWNSTHTVQLVSYYSVFGRMDQFLIGMIAARALANGRTGAFFSDKRVAIGVFGAGVIATVAFFWWFNSNGGLLSFRGEPWPSKSPIWIVVPTIESVVFGAVLVGYLHLPGISYLGWLSKAFAYVGRVSYSIYLDHVLVIAGVTKLLAWFHFSPGSWEMSIVACILIAMPCLVAVASVTYFLIEKPFMDLRRQRTAVTPGA
jgi:peptidoglycan/LPS O-acetylase OafA/YrhL